MIDSVTINQLRAFVAVCDEGSFQALHACWSALNRR